MSVCFISQENLQLFHNHRTCDESGENLESPEPQTFPLGPRYPPRLPVSVISAFKLRVPLTSCRNKACDASTRPSPSAKDLKDALRRLPPILPRLPGHPVHPKPSGPVTAKRRIRFSRRQTVRRSSSGIERRTVVPVNGAPPRIIMALPGTFLYPGATLLKPLVTPEPPRFVLLPPGCVITDSHASQSQSAQPNPSRHPDAAEVEADDLVEEPEELLAAVPFLTLSESSGSPAPSLDDEDGDTAGEGEGPASTSAHARGVGERRLSVTAVETSALRGPEIQVSNPWNDSRG